MKDTPILAFRFLKCRKAQSCAWILLFSMKACLYRNSYRKLLTCLKRVQWFSAKNWTKMWLWCAVFAYTPKRNTNHVPFAAADAEPGKPYHDHNQNKNRYSHIEYTPL